MAYIGPKPSQTLATPTSQYFNGTGSQTVFTLNRAVNVSEDLEVFVNNIQQEPGVGKSYTATGTTLTFDGAPSSGTANVYVVYRGLAEVTTRLEHDPNAALAATTGTFSGNVDVTGTVTADGLTVASALAPVTINRTGAGNANIYLQNDGSDGGLIGTDGSGDTIFFNNSGVEKVRIDSSGFVGIGTSSPEGLIGLPATASNTPKFRLQSASTNTDFAISSYADANGTYVSLGANHYLNSSGNDAVFETTDKSAYVVLDARNNGMVGFGTNSSGVATERMRIDSSGNLLVGTTSAPTTLISATSGGGIALDPNSFSAWNREATASNHSHLVFNQTGVDAQYLQFRKDGSTVGSIGTWSSGLLVGTGDVGLAFVDGTPERIQPRKADDQTSADALIDLGHTSNRFKNLYLSGGVYLGGTGSANKLDDYEEGEWNPVVNAPGITLTGGDQKGWYTKIGNMVFFKASIYHTGGSGTSTGNLSISGLPFTSAAYDGDNIASGAMGTNDSAWGAITPTHWRIGWASTTISLHTKDSSDARDSSQSEVDASNYVGYATMRFTGMYWV